MSIVLQRSDVAVIGLAMRCMLLQPGRACYRWGDEVPISLYEGIVAGDRMFLVNIWLRQVLLVKTFKSFGKILYHFLQSGPKLWPDFILWGNLTKLFLNLDKFMNGTDFSHSLSTFVFLKKNECYFYDNFLFSFQRNKHFSPSSPTL